MEWFYVTSVMVTKFALLLLYLRVFAVSTRFRLTVYFVATTVALWAIVLYIVLVRFSYREYLIPSLVVSVRGTRPEKPAGIRSPVVGFTDGATTTLGSAMRSCPCGLATVGPGEVS